MIYLYTEDSKSGFHFWEFICDKLFPGKIEVKNLGEKSNSTRLADFVCNIKDRENVYLISYDLSFDNQFVMENYREMKKYVKKNNFNNIIFLDFISFEYILLSFDKFVDWCFTENDFLKEKRRDLLECRGILINLGDNIESYLEYDCLRVYVQKHHISNIEQCCSKLIKGIVKNTGFEISKGKLGECWYVDCCTYSQKEEDDECGLSNSTPTSGTKAFEIFNHSCIKSRFDNFGIYTSDPCKQSAPHGIYSEKMNLFD